MKERALETELKFEQKFNSWKFELWILQLEVLRGIKQGNATDNEEILRMHIFLFQEFIILFLT